MTRFSIQPVILAMILVISPLASASGGGGYGGGSYSSPEPRQVDHAYERGKAIYSGRDKKIGKIKYCITSNEDKVKLTRKTIKPFRGSNQVELSKNLFNCDKPDELIYAKLGKDDFLYVVYYLNKRYKLKLG